jgi:hypothetical protein
MIDILKKFPLSIVIEIDGQAVDSPKKGVDKRTKGTKEDLARLSTLARELQEKNQGISSFNIDEIVALYTEFFAIDPENIVNNLNSQFSSRIKAIEAGVAENRIPDSNTILEALSDLRQRGILSEEGGDLFVQRHKLAYAKRALLLIEKDVKEINSKRLEKGENPLTTEEINTTKTLIETEITNLSNQINELAKQVSPETLKLLPAVITEVVATTKTESEENKRVESIQPEIQTVEPPTLEAFKEAADVYKAKLDEILKINLSTIRQDNKKIALLKAVQNLRQVYSDAVHNLTLADSKENSTLIFSINNELSPKETKFLQEVRDKWSGSFGSRQVNSLISNLFKNSPKLPEVKSAETASPTIEVASVVIPEPTPEKPKTIKINGNDVQLTPTNDPNKYELTWSDGGKVIVELKEGGDYVISNGNNNTPRTGTEEIDNEIKEALNNAAFKPQAQPLIAEEPTLLVPEAGSVSEPEQTQGVEGTTETVTGNVSNMKVSVPMGRVKPQELEPPDVEAKAVEAVVVSEPAAQPAINLKENESYKALEKELEKYINVYSDPVSTDQAIKKARAEYNIVFGAFVSDSTIDTPIKHKVQNLVSTQVYLAESIRTLKETKDTDSTEKSNLENEIKNYEDRLLKNLMVIYNDSETRYSNDFDFAYRFSPEELEGAPSSYLSDSKKSFDKLLNDIETAIKDQPEIIKNSAKTILEKRQNELKEAQEKYFQEWKESIKKIEINNKTSLDDDLNYFSYNQQKLKEAIAYAEAFGLENNVVLGLNTVVAEYGNQLIQKYPSLGKTTNALEFAIQSNKIEQLNQELADERQARERLDKTAANAHQHLNTKVDTLTNSVASGISAIGKTVADELGQTRTELGQIKTKLGETETKLKGLKTELEKRVTMPVAGGLAALAGFIGAGLSYLGLKPAIDNAVKDAIKANLPDESKKKTV